MDWQPIETAPKEGQILLCCMTPGEWSRRKPGYMGVDEWDEAIGWGSFNKHHFPPTHWMPLPEPPK